jgi:hypothetical protein
LATQRETPLEDDLKRGFRNKGYLYFRP